MKKQSGFTLIELLLVLAIIGIISAIAIPALLGQRARAKDKTCITAVSGTIGDLVGRYDKAKEAGKSATDCIASMVAVLTEANARGDKNPWSTTGGAAFATKIVASANPSTKGEATFYVDNIASPSQLIGKVVTNFTQSSTNANRFEKRVALD